MSRDSAPRGRVVAVDFRRYSRTTTQPKAGTWRPSPEAQIVDGALVCPRCGCREMHQADIEVWRRSEDSDGDSVALSACCPNDEPRRTKRSAAAFARRGRRQFLELRFVCEQCEAVDSSDPGPTLAVIQHKGATLLQWVDAKSIARAGA